MFSVTWTEGLSVMLDKVAPLFCLLQSYRLEKQNYFYFYLPHWMTTFSGGLVPGCTHRLSTWTTWKLNTPIH